MIPAELILTLQNVPGLGARRIRTILNTYPHITEWKDLLDSNLSVVDGISGTLIDRIHGAQPQYGLSILDRIHELGARFINISQPVYPALLKELYDAPVGLFIHGAGKLEGDFIAVVGTRRPTSYGRETARALSHALVASGLGIVSGFARGIDSTAHTAALETGGLTVAVMGCGVDVVYPPENRKLYERLLENGLIVSEYPPGANPDAHHFPQRNRIISGLSLGTLVVEAGLGSGALITAVHALDLGRGVFAVPGKIDSPRSEGCHNLINSGAKLVAKVEDVLLELQPPYSAVPGDQLSIVPDLPAPERSIMEYLNREPVPVDRIAEDLNTDVSELLTTLLYLEMKGLVTQAAGKRFARAV
ncbi:MAG: DNA-processing protein DprA [Candidatus Marinimicrobia bacterium]|nr:DNA-processing protein DprA [Candidatus Neomarinimicrobiota bacterium]